MVAPLLAILASAFGLCLVLTPVVRALAVRFQLLDRPDARRKMHSRPTPLGGGLAILTSGAVVLAAAAFLPGEYGGMLRDHGRPLVGLLLAAVALCAVGVADDSGCLRGRHKLAGQVLAVCVLICFGLVIRRVRFLDQEIELGLLAVPVTILWLLGSINAMNLLDGMDGLLSSVGLIMSLALALTAALLGQWAAACAACALAGALMGFLRYNFPPASIFLGDCGSMPIGLIVGALALEVSMQESATLVIAAPAALLAVPFFDTAVAIVRRKLTGRSIYVTDRSHLHHRLLHRGFSRCQVLFCIGLACLLTACGFAMSLVWQSELFALLAAFTVVGVFLSTRLFGSAELELLHRGLLNLGRSFVFWGKRGTGKQLEVRLQGSAAWQEIWNELVGCAARLNLVAVRFNVNAPAIQEAYHARWDRGGSESEEASLWRAEIPLAVNGVVVAHLEVTGRPDEQPVSEKLADLAKLTEYFEAAISTLAGHAGGAARSGRAEARPPVSLGFPPAAHGQAGVGRGAHQPPPTPEWDVVWFGSPGGG